MQDYLRSLTSTLLIHEIIKQPVWLDIILQVQVLQHTGLLFWTLSIA